VLDAQGRQQAEPGRAPAAAPAARTKTELIGAVSARVDRFEADDRSPVLEPGAADDARQLSELLTAEGRDDLDAWDTLGLFWYMRLLSLPAEAEAERDEAVNGAVRGYLPLFLAGREVPQRLLAAVAEEALGVAVELVEQVEATLDRGLSEQLVALTQRILDATPADDEDRPVYQYLLGSARFGRSGTPPRSTSPTPSTPACRPGRVPSTREPRPRRCTTPSAPCATSATCAPAPPTGLPSCTQAPSRSGQVSEHTSGGQAWPPKATSPRRSPSAGRAQPAVPPRSPAAFLGAGGMWRKITRAAGAVSSRAATNPAIASATAPGARRGR
jgi:hypothetical protein